jgi:hypothetical protein
VQEGHVVIGTCNEAIEGASHLDTDARRCGHRGLPVYRCRVIYADVQPSCGHPLAKVHRHRA